MKTLTRSLFVLTLLFHVVSVGSARGGYWQTNVIATVGNTGSWPQVSDGRVAWREGIGSQAEIYVYEDGIINKLTDNETADELIGIAGDYIAWQQFVSAGSTEQTQQMNLVVNGNVIAAGVPYISDAYLGRNGLAWCNIYHDIGPSVIYFYDGLSVRTLSFGGTRSNHNPDISGSRVVWSGFDDDGNHAYMYDGQGISKLPNGVGIGQTPRIDGDYVTGILEDDTGHSSGVTRYNIASGQLETFPADTRFTSTPYISAKQMAWVADVDGRFEIIALDTQQMPVQLTVGEFRTGPFVTDSFVAWSGAQGGVFAFSGDSTVRILNSDMSSVLTDADENNLVWLRSNGASSEIVLATFITPEPSGITIAGIGFVVCFMRGRRRINKAT